MIESKEEVLAAARSLVPEQVRLLPGGELRRRYRNVAAAEGVESWEPSGAVRELSGWAGGGYLPALILEAKEAADARRILLVASPHADEPIGVATALAVMESLLGAEGRALRGHLSVAVVPVANPAGYAANERWFDSANALEDWFDESGANNSSDTNIDDDEYFRLAREYLADYLLYRRRSLPEDDVEFGYGAAFVEGDSVPNAGPENSHADYLPPCRAHAAFYDYLTSRWGGVDVHAPLHSMGVAGGAWALLRVAPSDVETPAVRHLMETYTAAAAETGLGLHDDDRRGEKGFWRLGPGFHTTPTAEAMRAYFAEQGDTIRIRYNSVQAIGNRARQAVIPEVPLFEVAPLSDATEIAEPLRSILKRRADTSAACAQRLEGIENSDVEGYRTYWERNAAAFARGANQAGSKRAALRREAARARCEEALRPALAHALGAEARREDPDRARMERLAASLLTEECWRPVPLRSQAYLQIVLALAALRA